MDLFHAHSRNHETSGRPCSLAEMAIPAVVVVVVVVVVVARRLATRSAFGKSRRSSSLGKEVESEIMHARVYHARVST